jgi:hypothetical protein
MARARGRGRSRDERRGKKKFQDYNAGFESGLSKTASPFRGHHLKLQDGEPVLRKNKVAQAKFMPAPKKGCIYVRDVRRGTGEMIMVKKGSIDHFMSLEKGKGNA